MRDSKVVRGSDCGVVIGAVRSAKLEPQSAAALRARQVWTAGDFDAIGRGFSADAAAFIDRLGIVAGERVLDVACGTGNLTIPAARGGAKVTGLDIAPNLLAVARRRAEQERLEIGFDEGDAAALPYPDGAFDTVVSMFGAMFAADPVQVTRELLRVTRPGGRIAMANWVPDGFIGRMFRLHAAFAPPPAGVPSPLLWGDPEVVGARFSVGTKSLSTARRTLVFRYPHRPAGVAELFRACYGPTVRLFEAIDPDGRVDLSERLTTLWTEQAVVEDGFTRVPAEYLEVVALRAA